MPRLHQNAPFEAQLKNCRGSFPPHPPNKAWLPHAGASPLFRLWTRPYNLDPPCARQVKRLNAFYMQNSKTDFWHQVA